MMPNRITWMWPAKQHTRWTKTRQKGRWNFVFYRGILGWGGFMFVVLTVCPVLFGMPHKAVNTPTYWVVQSLLWFGGGFVWGLATWAMSEKYYLRAEAEGLYSNSK